MGLGRSEGVGVGCSGLSVDSLGFDLFCSIVSLNVMFCWFAEST